MGWNVPRILPAGASYVEVSTGLKYFTQATPCTFCKIDGDDCLQHLHSHLVSRLVKSALCGVVVTSKSADFARSLNLFDFAAAERLGLSPLRSRDKAVYCQPCHAKALTAEVSGRPACLGPWTAAYLRSKASAATWLAKIVRG